MPYSWSRFAGLSIALLALIVGGSPALAHAFAGYTLHNELELYVRAGIPAPEVLRMATLTPAQVLGVDGPSQRGFIAPGRLADMVLIDGDPTRDIADIRHVWRTIKGGQVYDPAALEQAMGMSP